MKLLNIGIIGFGMAGKVFHAPIIKSLPYLRLTKVFAASCTSSQYLANKYPEAEAAATVDDILRDPEIDLVVVATPNTFHKQYAAEALLARKHVVVEKPFTINAQDADELISLAKKQGCILTVHQNRRWDSDFLTVKKIVNSGLLGEVVEYEAHFDRFRNSIKDNAWREEAQAGSGVLYDLGSHLIDQALALFGMPLEITADIGIQRQGGRVDDYFEVILHYSSKRAVLKASALVREQLPHFIVLGNKGSFVKYGMDVQEAALKSGARPDKEEKWGIEPEALHGTINTDVNGIHIRGTVESEAGDYRKYYENVYWAIQGKEELLVKPEEARNVIRIIEIAMESNLKKKRIRLL